MSHSFGTRLDGIQTVEDLMGRCFVPEQDGCWHLRNARGRPFADGVTARVWIYGSTQSMTATRAAWLLAHPGRSIPNGWRCYRACESKDCVRPDHIKCGHPRQMGAAWRASGKMKTAAKQAAARATIKPLQKLTPETKLWLLESGQGIADAAHGLGISPSRASALRAQQRQIVRLAKAASVFAWRPT